MTDFGRILRTAAYLRPGQITNRIARRIPRPVDTSGLDIPLRVWDGRWIICPGRPVFLVGPERVRLLNQEADIGDPSIWNDPRRAKLWLYHLHYFDDLLSEGAPSRADWHHRLIERWIDENPPASGNGWEPYTLSRRIGNWIAWALGGGALSQRARASLVLQARVLAGRLEYHLLGNHLFSNGRALVFAGCFFDGPEPRRWLQKGLAILDTEFREQILADGGHFELSPMYHAIAVEDTIDLVQLAERYSKLSDLRSRVSAWREIAGRMMSWLWAMSHPDGEIALYNDATFMQARSPNDLRAYAVQIGCQPGSVPDPLTFLRESGYIRLSTGDWSVIFDAAQIGPTYIPGHGHADTLSVELSLGQERIISNSGISTYALGAQRERERSTAAHATVEIDGENSSETWASFRVGRRARAFDVKAEASASGLACQAAHDGYRFLAGRPVHFRRVELDPARVIIRDRIDNGDRHTAIGRLPIHPSVQINAVGECAFRLQTGSGAALSLTIRGAEKCAIEKGTFAPHFGRCLPRPVIAWTSRGSCSVETMIAPVD